MLRSIIGEKRGALNLKSAEFIDPCIGYKKAPLLTRIKEHRLDSNALVVARWELDPETVPLLADDMSALINEILKRPEVDTDRVGLYGVSQASWVMLLVMANEPDLWNWLAAKGFQP